LSNPTGVFHLHVDAGPDQGRELYVSREGANIGRSSRNEIVLNDPKLSRIHARLYFNTDHTLSISDLGSTNETLVNHKPVREQTLYPGDIMQMGDTVLRVVANDPPKADASTPTPSPAAPRPEASSWLRPAAVALVIIGVLALFATRAGRSRTEAETGAVIAPPDPLSVSYERVEASHEHVRRVFVELRRGQGRLEVDDTADGRRITREKALGEESVAALLAGLDNPAFFELRPDYQSLPAGELVQRSLTVTIETRTRSVSVMNRPGPEAFLAAEGIVSDVLLAEMGINDLSLQEYEVQSLADSAIERGQEAYRARGERPDGLYQAITAFEDAAWYGSLLHQPPVGLEGTRALLEDCRKELDEAYEDESFKAEQSILFKDWQTALGHLNRIREMIPNPLDARYINAGIRSRLAEEQLRE
jgi:pSer/pThr/pTyr-binding forkhead associated (FHA) protein